MIHGIYSSRNLKFKPVLKELEEEKVKKKKKKTE